MFRILSIPFLCAVALASYLPDASSIASGPVGYAAAAAPAMGYAAAPAMGLAAVPAMGYAAGPAMGGFTQAMSFVGPVASSYGHVTRAVPFWGYGSAPFINSVISPNIFGAPTIGYAAAPAVGYASNSPGY